jgi:phage shock protein PspC (stress-responsive transcriptional regulator)
LKGAHLAAPIWPASCPGQRHGLPGQEGKPGLEKPREHLQGRARVKWGVSPIRTGLRPAKNGLMTDHSSETPPPGPSDGRRRLTRSTKDRMVAGVAGGVAEYLDVDPVAVRIGFIVAAFILGGIGGIVLYVLMWVIVPEEGKTGSIASDVLKSNPWQQSGQDTSR